jgi:hypothetical protein
MNDLELQAVIGSLKQVNLKPKIREGIQTLVRELQALNDKYTQELLQINTDSRYTKEGKKLLKQEAGANLMAELEVYTDPYQEHIEQAERKLLSGDQQTEKSDMARVVDYLKQSELRRMYGIEKMDELQIEAKSSDPQFLDAVLTSPKPLLPQEKLDKLIRQKASTASPEIGVELKQLNFCNKTVNGLVKSITATVKSNGWKGSDLVEQAA